MTTWVITGANRGIGRRMTELLLAEGDRVIAGVRPGREDQLANLAERSSNLVVRAVDVANPVSIARFGEETHEPVHILINNAGVLLADNVSTLDPDLDWSIFEESFRVNSIGPLFVTRALLPRMGAGARMLAISSSMGSMSRDASDTTAYRASKAALNKIIQGLARDLNTRGIAVAAVHPGWVRTDMGGQSADLDVTASASDLIRLARGLDLSQTGQFLSHNGRKLPW